MTVNITLDLGREQYMNLLKKRMDDDSEKNDFKCIISGELQIADFDKMKAKEVKGKLLLSEESDIESDKLLDPVVWKMIKEEIREEYGLSHVAYRTWVEPLMIRKIERETVTIDVPKYCGVEYVKLKYGDILHKKMEEWIGKKLRLEFTIGNDL